MDLNDARTLITVLMFVLFSAVCFWAYSKAPKQRFKESEQMPFDDDDEKMHQKSLESDDL